MEDMMTRRPPHVSASRLSALAFAALVVCAGRQGFAQDMHHAFSPHGDTPSQMDLGRSTLTPQGMGHWTLTRKRSGQSRVVEGAELESVLLGRRWYEQESGFTAVWTRRGLSDIFDAQWTGPGLVTAALRITLDGWDRVEIRRRGSSDGNDCRYTGQFAGGYGTVDATRVSGTYTCRNGGPFPWSATIEH
jgi:hypothetical protein